MAIISQIFHLISWFWNTILLHFVTVGMYTYTQKFMISKFSVNSARLWTAGMYKFDNEFAKQ